MRIAVTGGAGFIGANFVIEASKLGLEITVVDSMTYAASPEALDGVSGVEIRKVDIRDSKNLEKALEGCDTVVHFAAETHNDNSLNDPEPFISTNVNGTFNLLEVCRKRDLRFHHVSTDEVFGDLPISGDSSFNEETPYHPSSPYSASKAASDHLVRAWVRSFGLRATISNCSNNFGPFQHPEKLIPRTIKTILEGGMPEVYGDGSNVRDWIHVSDHITGIFGILERGSIGETYLLGAENEKSNLEIVQQILTTMGKPKDYIKFIADRPGHDLRYSIDASKAKRELNFKPESMDFYNQLEETVEWYVGRLS